jgi:hypothetical protein
MLLKDEILKYNHYKVSRYFDYIDLGFGTQFNYYFPQMFMQKGLLPKDIIRDSTKIQNSMILNLFPIDDNNDDIFYDAPFHSSIPDNIKEKYNLKEDGDGVTGNSLKDQVNSAINSFQSQIINKNSKLSNLSFVKIKEIRNKKLKKIKRLKKIIQSHQFKQELKDLKKLVKLSKKSELKSKIRKKSSSKNQVKRRISKLKHKMIPIILHKKMTEKRTKQLSLNSSVFFEPLKEKLKHKIQKNDDIDDNSVSVSNYLSNKKVKGRARINKFNWALLGLVKLGYK